MKILSILAIPFFLMGCDKAFNEVQNRFSGKIQDTYLESVGQGKHIDGVKANYLKTIEKGVQDLKQLNDPNIDEVYAVINKHLNDNDMSMYDYNSIMSLINAHKKELNLLNSKHKNDVSAFKDKLNQE